MRKAAFTGWIRSVYNSKTRIVTGVVISRYCTNTSPRMILLHGGWQPGQGREPAPGSQELAGKLSRRGSTAGAECPRFEWRTEARSGLPWDNLPGNAVIAAMTSTWLNPDGDGTGGAVLKHLKPDQASDAGASANLRSACVSACRDQLGSSILKRC